MAESFYKAFGSESQTDSEKNLSKEQKLEELLLNPEVKQVPFSPVLRQEWLNYDHQTALGIAVRIYDEKALDSLPVFADALEDAGCRDENVLDQFRDSSMRASAILLICEALGKTPSIEQYRSALSEKGILTSEIVEQMLDRAAEEEKEESKRQKRYIAPKQESIIIASARQLGISGSRNFDPTSVSMSILADEAYRNFGIDKLSVAEALDFALKYKGEKFKQYSIAMTGISTDGENYTLEFGIYSDGTSLSHISAHQSYSVDRPIVFSRRQS